MLAIIYMANIHDCINYHIFWTIKKNNLFFAIKWKNNDGHKFVKQAIEKGAIKSVVSKKIKKLSINKIIKVQNTYSSLKKLA